MRDKADKIQQDTILMTKLARETELFTILTEGAMTQVFELLTTRAFCILQDIANTFRITICIDDEITILNEFGIQIEFEEVNHMVFVVVGVFDGNFAKEIPFKNITYREDTLCH